MLDSIETQVFSLIKAKFSAKIKSKYPDLNFTMVDKSSTKPKFPNVYIHLLPSNTIGKTLEGNTIEGIDATFQVDVQDNQSQQRATEVSNEVLRVMVSMRFEPKPMPNFENTGDTYRKTARYYRPIGGGDIL